MPLLAGSTPAPRFIISKGEFCEAMKDFNVPIQSLIDHIKTAIDVDPWAKEMAEELLKEQEAVKPQTENAVYDIGSWWYICGACKKPIDKTDTFCRHCGRSVKWE